MWALLFRLSDNWKKEEEEEMKLATGCTGRHAEDWRGKRNGRYVCMKHV